MANYTSNKNLYKPNRNDDIAVDTSLADNFQKIDVEFGNNDQDHQDFSNKHQELEKFQNPSLNTQAEMDREYSTMRHYPVKLNTPTYEGSGIVVHPDVIYIHEGFGSDGWRYWMAMTPMPFRDDIYENPSIIASHDGVTWVEPDGITNPIVPKPNLDGHNSDVCLLHYNNQLYMYHRETRRTTPREQRIYVLTSSDGITWSAQTEVIYDNSDNAEGLVSPTVRFIDGQFVMWHLQGSGVIQRRTSTDGYTWSGPTTVTVNGLPSDRVEWHIQVMDNSDGQRLDMIFSTIESGNTNSGILHYGYSTDGGLTWNTGPAFIDEDLFPSETRLYRASIRNLYENPNLYEIWYSAYGSNTDYRIHYITAVRVNNQLYPLTPTDKKHVFDAALTTPSITAHGAAFQKVTIGGTVASGDHVEPKTKPGSGVVLNGWGMNTGMPLAWWKNPFEEIHLEGRLEADAGADTSDGTVLFVLPEGYRPEFNKMFRQRFADVYVQSNGNVAFYNFIERYICLDGVIFRAAQPLE